MILQSLTVSGFRNLEGQVLRPGPRATVLFGDNGQGKTNLLEALYFALAFRSFRARSADELIGWGRSRARVEVRLDLGGLERVLLVEIENGRRSFRLDGKVVRRDASALARVAAVLFVPEDLLLPRAAPADRRRFLDLAIFGTERGYYRVAQEYQRLLRARNVLLKQSRDGLTAAHGVVLDAYDEQLARAGAQVVERRRRAVASLRTRARAHFERIVGSPAIDLAYAEHATVTAAQSVEEVAEALLNGLRGRRALDLRRGFSGYGPHNDDLALFLGEQPARTHGSQGQLRALVLALKLAELEWLAESHGEAPVLLLDDVASELDQQRRERLFETIASLSCQTLISVTDRDFLPALRGRRDFRVEQGRLEEVA